MEVIDFEALWDVIESRFTKHLYKRHIVAINRVCEKRADGVFLDELTHFTKLLTICKEHIGNERLEFLAPTINVLSVSLRPYITAKSFEKIESEPAIKRHFETVSSILPLRFMYITITIAKGIQCYVRDVLDYKVVNDSGIICELVDGIRSWCYGARWKLEPRKLIKNHKDPQLQMLDTELSLELMAAIKRLSASPCCAKMLVEKWSILDLKMIYDPAMNDLFLTDSIESLWNLIENVPFEVTSKFIGTDYLNVFTALLSRLRLDIKRSNKANLKQLRNSILSIVLMLSKQACIL